jgi:hypothetical protein
METGKQLDVGFVSINPGRLHPVVSHTRQVHTQDVFIEFARIERVIKDQVPGG